MQIFNTIDYNTACNVFDAPSDDGSSTFIHNRTELVKKLASNSSISGSFPIQSVAIKASANVVTNNSSESTEDIKAFSLKYTKGSYTLKLKPEFLNDTSNLRKSFLDEILGLYSANPITDPNASDSWIPYNSFIDKYGSHIVTGVDFGASLKIWNSVKSSDDTILTLLQVKSCIQANANGSSPSGSATPVPGPGGKACTSVDSSTRSRAENLTADFNAYVSGGNSDTRQALTTAYSRYQPNNPNSDPPSSELIDNFLRSYQDSINPISFTFLSIWDYIKTLTISNFLYDETFQTKNTRLHSSSALTPIQAYQVAINLETAYVYNTIKCERKSANGTIYQEIKSNSGPNGTLYSCWQAKTGAKNFDTDCHGNGIGKTGGYCKAYGPSAFVGGTNDTLPSEQVLFPGTDQYRTVIRDKVAFNYNQGINQSCQADFWGICQFHDNFGAQLPDREIWRSGQK